MTRMRPVTAMVRPATRACGLATALALGASAGGWACAAGGDQAPVAGARCTELAAMTLIDFDIVSASTVSDVDGPPHCRVQGLIDEEINFELLLPDEWNGRFMMGGGGGYVGSVQNAALAYGAGPGALERGYATVGTDTGHQGEGVQAAWALHNETRQINFGHRAVHLTAEAARSIIRYYYEREEAYAYFVGCSRGGGQGMMASQRYPDDFDGIVAGAPAYHWTAFTAGFVQNQQAIFPDPSDLSTPVITRENRALLDASIRQACDRQDGVEDGVLNDPRHCAFAPASLPRCVDDRPGPDCVTAGQLAAIQAIYAGPISNGESIFRGFPFGGENDPGGWDRWIAGANRTAEPGAPNLHYGLGTELYKYFVFDDPDWDYTAYDFSTWSDDVAEASKILDATDPDLGPFRDAGGKLILWTGWSDSALTALGTIDYYDKVSALDPVATDYARLFMLPGVLHCGGGPGPDEVDWLTAIAAWVEQDAAPVRLVATKRSGPDGEMAPGLTRPVCAYPQVAAYDGSGATDDEANFRCQVP
ncbi:MAG: tannase/feruloyl esterase family alpha/beta hydrolase [Vicinamibacterales bacterium]|nr:tannase/feruloyl esterase family alpha/beta hydrolase [Vicinamibacterales bacterium]